LKNANTDNIDTKYIVKNYIKVIIQLKNVPSSNVDKDIFYLNLIKIGGTIKKIFITYFCNDFKKNFVNKIMCPFQILLDIRK